MKTVVQRVTRAEVRVGGDLVGRIDRGLLLFVGVEKGDAEADADATARKVAALRIFPGRTPMDLTVADARGACLVVSQFTLCAALGKGNRPSFEPAAEPAAPSRSTCASPRGCAPPASPSRPAASAPTWPSIW